MFSRILGAMSAMIGLLFGKYFVYDVYQQALANDPDILFSEKFAAGSFTFGIVGAVLLIFGDRCTKIAIEPGTFNKLTPIGWVLLLACAGVGYGCAVAFQNQLMSMGYSP